MDWNNLAQDTVQWRICLRGNEILAFINGGKYLNQLSDYFVLKNDSSMELISNILVYVERDSITSPNFTHKLHL